MACLDAWAVLAWLQGEQRAAAKVDAVVASGTAIMSWINVGEVACIVQRRHGAEARARIVTGLRASCRLEEPTAGRVLAAAEIKALNGVSYADAFAIATARAHHVPLLTGDPEILMAVEESEAVDLRA